MCCDLRKVYLRPLSRRVLLFFVPLPLALPLFAGVVQLRRRVRVRVRAGVGRGGAARGRGAQLRRWGELAVAGARVVVGA